MDVCCKWQNHGQRPTETGADPQLINEPLCSPWLGSAEQREAGNISRRACQLLFFSSTFKINHTGRKSVGTWEILSKTPCIVD